MGAEPALQQDTASSLAIPLLLEADSTALRAGDIPVAARPVRFPSQPPPAQPATPPQPVLSRAQHASTAHTARHSAAHHLGYASICSCSRVITKMSPSSAREGSDANPSSLRPHIATAWLDATSCNGQQGGGAFLVIASVAARAAALQVAAGAAWADLGVSTLLLAYTLPAGWALCPASASNPPRSHPLGSSRNGQAAESRPVVLLCPEQGAPGAAAA